MNIVEMEEIKSAISGVETKVEYNVGGIDQIKNNALLNAGSVVKSVQRGAIRKSESIQGGHDSIVSVALSTINPNKSIALIDGLDASFSKGEYYNANVQPAGIVLTSDKLQISIHHYAASSVSAGYALNANWQVIEFY